MLNHVKEFGLHYRGNGRVCGKLRAIDRFVLQKTCVGNSLENGCVRKGLSVSHLQSWDDSPGRRPERYGLR